MTLNVWNYEPNWAARRSEIARVVQEAHPDVVALQETRRDFRFERGRAQGEQLADRTGYVATSAVSQVYMPFPRVEEGLTILTRDKPLRSSTFALALDPHRRSDENHRICVYIALACGPYTVHVFNTHFSLDSQSRRTNARELARLVDRAAQAQPAVVMGDLNAEPGAPEIRYLVEEAGFGDAWRLGAGADNGFTYASFNPVRRIDYILVKNMPSGPVRTWLVGATPTGPAYMSDHLGVVADLPLP